MSAGEKRERAAQRIRDTKERKRQRYWKKKEENGFAGVSQVGRHYWLWSILL